MWQRGCVVVDNFHFDLNIEGDFAPWQPAMVYSVWRANFLRWSSEYDRNEAFGHPGNFACLAYPNTVLAVCLTSIFKSHLMFIQLFKANRFELEQGNSTLMSRIRDVIREVSAYYLDFILNRFVYGFRDCHEEHRVAELRRQIEVWLLHAQMPPLVPFD